MSDNYIKIFICLAMLLVLLWVGYVVSPEIRTGFNKLGANVQMADDSSRYEAMKKVEDSCRAMIAQYNSDKLTYEQYAGSSSKEERGWAEQARMRANRTASTYNNYVLQNKFVWHDNIPDDLRIELEIF